MIDRNDLRIGNMVDYEKTTHIIDELEWNACTTYWWKDADQSDPYLTFYSEINPIPLAPELLAKAGFIKQGAEYSEWFTNESLLIEFIPDGVIHARLAISDESSYWIRRIKYLHELQNLYYAINSNELQINL